ncbi:MAG: hypothetical protein Q9217_005923 [Psora testacea]
METMRRSQEENCGARNGHPPKEKVPRLSCLDLHPSAYALQSLLQNPVRFVTATKRTSEDETGMTPTLPSRRRYSEPGANEPQRQYGAQTGEISAEWDSRWAGAMNSRGFQNPHVMCYRNSIIQALLHAPKFVNWLQSCHAECPFRSYCTVCALRHLCLHYWDPTYQPKTVAQRMAHFSATLRGTATFARWSWCEQQDANEFYLYLVNAIIERHRSSENVMQAILGHKIARTTTCLSCGKKSRVVSPYEYRLGVALGRESQLQSLLRSSTFALASISDYSCTGCNRRSRATQSSRLTTVPEILEIELLRFSQLRPGRYIKNSKKVSFDQDLDLTAVSESNATVRYRLLSVVQHLGSYENGHYRCIAQGPGGHWEDLDDSTVRKVTMGTALSPAGTWTPYALFYARVDASGPIEGGPTPHVNNTAAHTVSSNTECRITKKQRLTNGVSIPAYSRSNVQGYTVVG